MTTKNRDAYIGARIRELRQERRWTQKQLAALLHITQGYLSKLERGNGSLPADRLLTILRHFNVQLDYFSPKTASAGDQIQNALARQGAAHLAESSDVLPSTQLRHAIDAIREALVSSDSARQVAAVAPVIVAHAGNINLTRLRNELAELGLENRLAWAVDCTLEAIKLESTRILPRQWRLKYRRAAVIIESFFGPWRIFPRATQNPEVPPQYDVLDPEITSRKALQEAIAELSPVAQRWRIATRIEVDDFARALRGARGAD